MNTDVIDEYISESQENLRLFQQERSIYEVTAMIEGLMREHCVSRTELADKLGKSRSWVTQLLDGEANKTIRTIADVCAVLGYEFHGTVELIATDRVWSSSVDEFPYPSVLRIPVDRVHWQDTTSFSTTNRFKLVS